MVFFIYSIYNIDLFWCICLDLSVPRFLEKIVTTPTPFLSVTAYNRTPLGTKIDGLPKSIANASSLIKHYDYSARLPVVGEKMVIGYAGIYVVIDIIWEAPKDGDVFVSNVIVEPWIENKFGRLAIAKLEEMGFEPMVKTSSDPF